VFRFEPVIRLVRAGQTITLKLLIPRRALRGVKRALGRGRRLKANVAVTAADAAGNETVARRAVRLRG
jgi:hypothetical protein